MFVHVAPPEAHPRHTAAHARHRPATASQTSTVAFDRKGKASAKTGIDGLTPGGRAWGAQALVRRTLLCKSLSLPPIHGHARKTFLQDDCQSDSKRCQHSTNFKGSRVSQPWVRLRGSHTSKHPRHTTAHARHRAAAPRHVPKVGVDRLGECGSDTKTEETRHTNLSDERGEPKLWCAGPSSAKA